MELNLQDLQNGDLVERLSSAVHVQLHYHLRHIILVQVASLGQHIAADAGFAAI